MGHGRLHRRARPGCRWTAERLSGHDPLAKSGAIAAGRRHAGCRASGRRPQSRYGGRHYGRDRFRPGTGRRTARPRGGRKDSARDGVCSRSPFFVGLACHGRSATGAAGFGRPPSTVRPAAGKSVAPPARQVSGRAPVIAPRRKRPPVAVAGHPNSSLPSLSPKRSVGAPRRSSIAR